MAECVTQNDIDYHFNSKSKDKKIINKCKINVDNINQLEDIRNKYPIPGYTVGVNVENINVKMYGGGLDFNGRKMPDNALFDLASITKFYTQIIAYNLIKEGYFSFSDKHLL